ncbi:hypothetical protein HCZ23_10495 [Celeribacter sp. HF31]|nr:hypothetical protein [Celeribacter sp. HF31]NIY79895.1 hypothetical protein [Celeribacter sp. HF31]
MCKLLMMRFGYAPMADVGGAGVYPVADRGGIEVRQGSAATAMPSWTGCP